MQRTSTAVWQGSGKEGRGTLSTQSPVIQNQPYSYHSRFENAAGTNPEELIAAAHAGCFSMKLSFVLGELGFIPELLETQCTITLEGGTITGSHLVLTATVKGITHEQMEEAVESAKLHCPVSKALSPPITVEYTLNN